MPLPEDEKSSTAVAVSRVTVREWWQSPVQIGFIDIKVPAIKAWNPAKVSYHVFFKEYSRKWFIWFLRSPGHRIEYLCIIKATVTTYCSTHLASHALPLTKSSDHCYLFFSGLNKSKAYILVLCSALQIFRGCFANMIAFTITRSKDFILYLS